MKTFRTFKLSAEDRARARRALALGGARFVEGIAPARGGQVEDEVPADRLADTVLDKVCGYNPKPVCWAAVDRKTGLVRAGCCGAERRVRSVKLSPDGYLKSLVTASTRRR